MTNLSENSTTTKAAANLKLIPWIEQELPFAEGPQQESDESLQEELEPGQDSDELRYVQPGEVKRVNLPWKEKPQLVEPSVEKPVRLPWEDEPRQAESDIVNSVDLPFEGESEEVSDTGNSLPQSPTDESDPESETTNLITILH